MAATVREEFDGGARDARLAASLGAADTSLTVTPGGLSTWPTGAAGRIAVILSPGLSEEEHAYATGVTGDTLTGLVRGVDGTSASVHGAGAVVRHGLHASHVDAANAFLSAPTAAGQFAVSVGPDEWGAGPIPAGTPLDAPAITDFTAAPHDHGDAAGGGLLPSGPPVASAVGDTAAEGVATGYSRQDHRHPREGFGAPVASAPGDTLASGTAVTVAHSDHRHPREGYASAATTLPDPGTAGTPGTGDTVARGDHTHTLPPFGGAERLNPTITSDAGLSEAPARASHLHGLPFQAGVETVAVAGSNAGTGAVTFASPYTLPPVIAPGVEVGSNLDIGVNVVSRSVSGFTYRVYSNSGGTFTASVKVHWIAYGEIA